MLAPRLLEGGVALFIGDVQSRSVGKRHHLRAALRLASALAMFGVALLPLFLILGVHGPVGGREAVVGGALEDVQMVGSFGQHRNGLDAGRSGADDADHLAFQVDALPRPAGGVVPGALVIADPFEIGDVGGGEATGRGDEILGRDGFAPIGSDGPAPGRLVVGRTDHGGFELDVTAQVEAVGHVVGVLLQLPLGRVVLAPLPLLLHVGVERQRVLHARAVHPGTGVPVPIPRPAHAIPGLDHPRRQAEPPEPPQQVQAAKPGANHHRVETGRVTRRLGQGPILCLHHLIAPPSVPGRVRARYGVDRPRYSAVPTLL